MIVLTAEQAEKVRGLSPKDTGSALLPVPLEDGRYILGEEVLDDPAHDDVREYMRSLPREAIEKLPLRGPDSIAVEVEQVSRIAARKQIDGKTAGLKPFVPEATVNDDERLVVESDKLAGDTRA